MNVAYASKRRQRQTRATDTLTGGSVQVWGENIYYEASGTGEDGPTMLLLHESGGTAATWRGQLVGLAEHARCLVPDLPGHGRSEGKGCATVGEYCRAVVGFLDALAIRWPVVLAGTCLGAAVAVELALQAPERVAGLILAGVCDSGRACEQVLGLTARGEAPEAFVRGLFSAGASQTLILEHMKRWRLTLPPVRHSDLVAVTRYPIAYSLEKVARPVLMVAGEKDPVASPARMAELARTVSDVRVVSIERAGCLSMLEQPGAFNRHVEAFLDAVRPAWPAVAAAGEPGGYRRF